MSFLTTSTFRASFNKLTKRDDSGYRSCREDILSFLQGKTFADINEFHYLLRHAGDVKVIKVRIANSHLNLSSAAGYRLIICCNSKHKHIAFLDIYPKKGKYGQLDLLPYQFKELLKTYANELRENRLQTF